MAKEKVYSLEYFAKKGIQGWDLTNEFVDIVSTYATNGNHHPQIAYEGPAPFFAAALYAEHYKRGGGTDSGFFPTNMRLAEQMADWLGAGDGMTIIDPGAGFGALGWAVQQRGAKPIMLEWAQWINRIGNAAWGVKLTPDLTFDGDLPIALADFVDGYAPPPFDAAIANPPFGKVFGHASIETDFMNKIADWSPRGTPVCVLLPNRYLNKERPKAAAEMRARYEIVNEEDQAPGEFKPLTNVATTMYLLETVADGPLYLQRKEMPTKKTASPETKPAKVKAAKPIEVETLEVETRPEPLHANLDNLPPMTASEARGWLKKLIDSAIDRMSLSWPTQPAHATAQVLWNGASLNVLTDIEPISTLEARHIWRETHTWNESKGEWNANA